MNKFDLFTDAELSCMEQALFLFAKSETRHTPGLLAEVREEIDVRNGPRPSDQRPASPDREIFNTP